MTSARSSGQRHRLVVVPGGGPLVPQRVLLAKGAEPGSHLFSWQAQGAWTSAAVEVVTSPQVPADVVAVSDALAAGLALDAAGPDVWRLDRKPPVPARSITLEHATEGDPREAVQEIVRAPLVGQLVWLPPDCREMWLRVGENTHRVHAVDVDDSRTGVIAEVTSSTKVELYAPSVRAGVDIVVLADGSQSMAVDDLKGDGGRASANGRPVWVRRIEALKAALDELLNMRLTVSGRTSQIAMLEFGETVAHRFPRKGAWPNSTPARRPDSSPSSGRPWPN